MTMRPIDLLMSATLSAFLGCACAHSSPPAAAAAALTPPTVPAALAVPAGAQVAARFHAVGAQVYVCGADPAGGAYAWTLKRPDAMLSDRDGRAVGSHGAGPTWTSTDGSSVVGKKVAQADAPDAGAIPWLLVRAVSTTGTGVFSNVTFIQRVATANGKSPPAGCGADNVATETRVAYSADYYFYTGGNGP
jgi:hypothetical protein